VQVRVGALLTRDLQERRRPVTEQRLLLLRLPLTPEPENAFPDPEKAQPVKEDAQDAEIPEEYRVA
jgi:hypothetical protein